MSKIRKEDFDERQLNDFPYQDKLENLGNTTKNYSRSIQHIDGLKVAEHVIFQLKDSTELAIDCEGVRLGRDGKLTLIQIAAEDNTVYLFDVLVLGGNLFEKGMKDLLENADIVKYMFDCKKDSVSLYHEYGVKLANVIDLQLYEFIVRPTTGTIPYPPKNEDEQTPPNTTKVAGLGRAVEAYVNCYEIKQAGLSGFFELKGAGDQLMNSERTLWRYRPLSDGMTRYAAMDIEMIWILRKNLQKLLPLTGITFQQVKIGSEIYASMQRDADKTPEGRYIKNALLPAYVIPDVDVDGKIVPHPVGDTQCGGCRRFFPSAFIIDKENICEHCKKVVSRNTNENRIIKHL